MQVQLFLLMWKDAPKENVGQILATKNLEDIDWWH